MPIKKQYSKTKPICKVTFSIDTKEAQNVAIVADFNNWDAEAGALSKQKSGTFKGVFALDKDASYEYKFLVDGEFVNDTEADAYQWNDYANNENSVVTV